jgi:hypothetical protein
LREQAPANEQISVLFNTSALLRTLLDTPWCLV